jgi:hypothetical protein
VAKCLDIVGHLQASGATKIQIGMHNIKFILERYTKGVCLYGYVSREVLSCCEYIFTLYYHNKFPSRVL